jgi:hypothetical protein
MSVIFTGLRLSVIPGVGGYPDLRLDVASQFCVVGTCLPASFLEGVLTNTFERQEERVCQATSMSVTISGFNIHLMSEPYFASLYELSVSFFLYGVFEHSSGDRLY